MVNGLSMGVIRIIPYPPSFSKTAARTIEPAIGASTWAFGSQRCSPYRGIFTMNASKHAVHSMVFVHENKICVCIMFVVSIDMLWCFVFKYSRDTSSGSEPARV